MISLALLLATSLVPKAAIEEATPGEFRHGGWLGRCYRDGTLRGMDKELCRAEMAGDVTISIERDVKQLKLTASVLGCNAEHGVGYVGAAALASPGRAGLLRLMVETQQKQALKACGNKGKPPKLVMADLEAMLRETDGLEPMS